ARRIERFEGMSDQRRDDDGIDFEVRNDLVEYAAILRMRDSHRTDWLVELPFAQGHAHVGARVKRQPLPEGPPGADRAQHEVVAHRVGAAEITDPAPQATTPAMRDVQLHGTHHRA